MKIFEVVLTKSYIVNIEARNKSEAMEYSEMFTDDIHNISSAADNSKFDFRIVNIDCKTNTAYEATEV